MKFTAGTVAFFITTSLVAARAHSPAKMECRDASNDIPEFATCFVTNANPVCVGQDETEIQATIETVMGCVNALDSAPESVRDLMDSGCLDEIKQCMRENAPDRGEQGPHGGPGGPGRPMIPPPIIEECQDSETLADFAGCFLSNVAPDDATCIDEAAIAEVTDCVSTYEIQEGEDIRQAIKNSGCFMTVSECIKGQFQEFLATLPECVPLELGTLGQCIRDNKETCMETCSGVVAPVLDVDPTNLDSCDGFQVQVMDLLCPAVSCCDACDEAFQDAAACVLAEYVGVSDCGFECTMTRRRSRELAFGDRIKKWFGKGPGRPADGDGPRGPAFGECLGMLRLESDTDVVTGKDVAAFLECLSGKYLDVIAREPMEGRPGGLRGDGPARN